MSEQLEREVLTRLKKTACQQEHCATENQDNVQLIVFNSDKAKKNGLMCSGCFADSQLLATIHPVQRFSLPIRKYLNILVNFYRVYAEAKESPEWGPTIVSKHAEEVKRKAEIFYNQGLKNTLQIVQYEHTLTKRAKEDLQKVHVDADFEKMVEFIGEQQVAEQERMILTNQLGHICDRIKMVQGKHRYATEEKIKKQSDEIVLRYQKNMQVVVRALKQLVEVHKELLKGLL